MNTLEQALEEIERLRKIIRTSSMIYQREEKDQVARANGVDPTTYYDLPYVEWARIRDNAGLTNTF